MDIYSPSEETSLYYEKELINITDFIMTFFQ